MGFATLEGIAVMLDILFRTGLEVRPVTFFLPRLRRFAAACLLALSTFTPCLAASALSSAEDRTTVIVVVGAPGETEYGQRFSQWATNWVNAVCKAEGKAITIGLAVTNSVPDKEQLKQTLSAEPKAVTGDLWLVLIGHGTFDGQEAKFNLRGPDISATELAVWMQPFKRPLAVINCASASAPFLAKLSAPGRVIITSTRSGYEQNYARFGQYISEAIIDPKADLDKDGQTSLLEAFLMASRRVAEFYETEGRLASEHSLIDDNGDGLGTPADWFRGIRAVKKSKDNTAVDGLRAHQFHLLRSEMERKLPAEKRLRRDELEQAISALREQKGQLNEDEYYGELEKLLLEMAQLYQ